jgi:hypothetical protein
MAHVLCVLYHDPVDGYPPTYARDDVAKTANLKLAITAGIGSDYVDLQAAIDRGISVAVGQRETDGLSTARSLTG